MSVDEFLAALPSDERAALNKLRRSIKTAAPLATEVISYGVPTFKQDGRALVAYGAAAEHCSFYLMSYDTMRVHAAELKSYKLGKGSIQFPADKPLPGALVAKIVRTRIAEVEKKARR
jgi:uncharacterized protein YdhG (YjbR/CyaY superfamily)